MVGIVIVSHSPKVADGVKDLALQMSKKNQPIEAVGGTEDGKIGSDPMRILSAIEKVNQGEGIIVLADIGSSIMSVGVAKEMLDEDVANSVYLANAPLVEGTIAAVIEASMGSSIDKILQTANDSRNLNKIL